ncbi:polyunsaturated fatty acid lipoxygenase ALOX15B isoform b [Homo sapiens]|uniref:Isoform B of Polyunsaturated fatty acid lipoxygenase ALOX15B n=1 Tax=Homo sapiens TaxID=9606 RepID=O15296-2|nr:polyunsaturated fatty acid lipoxygenase ALOX15B isoform b [Homo sapiens]|eukprot:NP_001034220.1 arachidonate 15-lipoxygenase B isoform b [Homo sapiens]
MAEFRVRVSTGEAFGAGTWDKVSVSIVGTRGESPPLPLDNLGKEFTAGAEEDFQVTLPEDVGRVLLLRVHKAPPVLPLLGPLAPDAWFCRWFQLTPPRGGHLLFPCYQWLEGAGTLVLQEGTAKVSWADHHPVLQQQRQEELQARQEMYQWKAYNPGWPHCLDEKTVEDLELNIKYSTAKNANFYLQAGSAFAEMKIKGLLDRKGLWRSLNEMKRIFNFRRTPAAEHAFEHWQEDAFFASQFLNGLNPVLIRRCHYLPKNFPVTDAMVASVLGPGTSLQAELEKGSLFLVDHGILSGIQTNVINGKPQFSAAPMTLLYQSPGCGPLLPLAIQLSQTPGPNSPIFLPTDDKWDWLLAKTWVRNAEFSFHEALTHLLHSHLLPEVFTLATLRQLPHCHPLFKSTGIGIEGFSELIQRNMKQLNYSLLCLPEDIRTRGVEDIPGYYYRDDGMQIWGIPSSLETREALVQYVTMVIFTCSAKHAAVSAGQFDSCAWMPNLPPSMQLPPPTSKGLATCEGFIATLPPVNATCDVILALWLLSKEPGDQRPLGTYPDEHFTEEAPRRSIATFQSRLAQISRGIQERNQGLVLPYTYLDPPLIENSVSI